jgi:hypothetical protein
MLTVLFAFTTILPLSLQAETEEKPAETPVCVLTTENCIVEVIRQSLIDLSCKKNEAGAPPAVERVDADPQGTGLEQPCKA